MVVVGRREADERTVAMRYMGGKDQEVLTLDAAVDKLVAETRSPAGERGVDSPF